MSAKKHKEEFEEIEDIEEIDDLEEFEDFDELEEFEDEDDFEDEEEFEESEPKTKKKNKKAKKAKSKKSKKVKAIVIPIVSVVLIAGIALGVLFGLGIIGDNTPGKAADNETLIIDMSGITYDYIATNVSNRDDFVAAVNNEEDIILDADIKLEPGDKLVLKSNIYGNGHLIDATDVLSKETDKYRWDQAPITIRSEKEVVIQDVYMTCYKLKEGEDLALDINLSYRGYPIMVATGSKALIKHCVLENGHRGIYIQAGSKVTVEGCIIRNCVDACISLETRDNEYGPSDVTLKNNVLMNACVAGVLIWGYDGNVTNPSQCNKLTVEGFLDIYNWKSAKDAKLMPATESAAAVGNKIIAGEITNEKNKQYTYVDENGKQYFHSGIIIIATGDQYGNDPVVKGTNEINYTKVDFPLPSVAAKIMKEFLIYNYQGNNPSIKPGDTINPDTIFQEVKTGR